MGKMHSLLCLKKCCWMWMSLGQASVISWFLSSDHLLSLPPWLFFADFINSCWLLWNYCLCSKEDVWWSKWKMMRPSGRKGLLLALSPPCCTASCLEIGREMSSNICCLGTEFSCCSIWDPAGCWHLWGTIPEQKEKKSHPEYTDNCFRYGKVA